MEAAYTLFMYEALLAIKQACADLSLTRAQIEALFSGNAERLMAKAAPQAT